MKKSIINISLTLFIAIIYIFLLPKSIGFGDSGTLAAAIVGNGIPHPTGFPSYLLISKFFTYIPFGDILFRLQLPSLLSGIILIYLLPSIFAKIAVALTFGFWYQSGNVESFLLTNLFIFGMIHLLSKEKISKYLLSLLIGIGSGLSPISIAIIPILGYEYRLSRKFWEMLAFSIPIIFIVYAYIPLSSHLNPFLNWGSPQTFSGIYHYFIGSGLNINSQNIVNGFTGSFFWYLQSWARFFTLAWTQLSPIVMILSILGLRHLWEASRRLFWSYLILLCTNISLAGVYISGNRDAWLLTSLITTVILASHGLEAFPKYKTMLAAVAVVVIGLSNIPSIIATHNLKLSSIYLDDLYSSLPNGAILLGSGETFNSLTLYARIVKQARPDIVPIDMSIYYGQSWYRDNLSKQNLGINTTISTPITFADSLEFSRILEEFADSNSNHPIFLAGSLLLNPIYANSSSPAYTPIKYHLATNGLTYELTSNSTNPKELSHYPSLTQIPLINSNSQKAINDITKEYAFSLETIGDYYLLNKDFNAANTRYFQASQINSEYFDQNRLSEKLKIDHKN